MRIKHFVDKCFVYCVSSYIDENTSAVVKSSLKFYPKLFSQNQYTQFCWKLFSQILPNLYLNFIGNFPPSYIDENTSVLVKSSAKFD